MNSGGIRVLAITITTPEPGATVDPSTCNPLTTTGTNTDNQPVYGLLFDPTAPDTPIAGTTQPTDGSTGPWAINFSLGNPTTNYGWVLRVIDNTSGTSQDCVFNIQPSTAPAVVTPEPLADPTEVQVTTTTAVGRTKKTTTTTSLLVSATINDPNPKFVHAEAYHSGKKKVYVGKVALTQNGGVTSVNATIDVSKVPKAALLKVRVSSYLPNGHAEVDHKKVHDPVSKKT
jgi:hypothetical protein